jgi:uncharacterized protein (TIGR02145 family)
MKTAKLFLSPLRREKSGRDSTLLTVCFSLRKMKTTKLFLLFALMFFFSPCLHAQVTIGGTANPKAGAILDLNSTDKGGLLLSNVTITDLEWIPYDNADVFPGITAGTADDNPELRGAIVYNDGQNPSVPAGIYIWNGKCWTKDGSVIEITPPSITIDGTVTDTYILEGGTVTFAVVSPQPGVSYTWYKTGISTPAGTGNSYTTPALPEGTYGYYCTAMSNCPSSNVNSGTLTINVLSLLSLPVGSASLSGRACFDVAQTNDGDSYGWLSVRQLTTLPVPVLRADFTQEATSRQTYTFTPPSGGANKLRFYAVESNGYTGQIIESLDYNRTLETQSNITNPQDLTIVYKNLNATAAGKDISLALKVDIYAVYLDGEDMIRSAKLTASIRDCACCGAFVDKGKWLNFMCHNLGASYGLFPFTPDAAIHGAKYKFGAQDASISMSDDQTYTNYTDWSSKPYQDDNQNWQTDNNPCPPAWRLPTRDEWDAVMNATNNPRTPIPDGNQENWNSNSSNYNTGTQIGNALFLPAAGYRLAISSGTILARGYNGYYWSSNSGNNSSGFALNFGASDTSSTFAENRPYGFSVRCVAD